MAKRLQTNDIKTRRFGDEMSPLSEDSGMELYKVFQKIE